MSGIFLMIFILVWGAIAVLLGNLLSKLFKRFTTNAQTGTTNLAHYLLKFLLIAVVFLLPIADEVISYPTYYKICEKAGKYEFASGMDAKKVFGREHQVKLETKLMRLFPNFHILSSNENAKSGVVIKLIKITIVDANTGEALLTSEGVIPIRSFFAIPWEDGRHPWLLYECSAVRGKNAENSKQLLRKLQLDW